MIIDAETAAAVKVADTRYEEKDRIRAGEPYTLNAENIAMISDQLQQMLVDNNFDNCEYLYILMTEDDSLGENYFRIARTIGRSFHRRAYYRPMKM